MFVPFITTRSQRLYPRKGGGGKGGGGKSGGSGGDDDGGSEGGSSGSSGGSSSAGRGATHEPVSGSTGGRSTTSSAYGAGGGSVFTIPQGQPFSGRQQGGGTRSQVFGTQTYGSGYPGTAGNRGVSHLNFPFYFWPIVWGSELGYGAAYLHDSSEYGDVNNSSRPGGPMAQAVFPDSASNNTFHLLADNSTVNSLIESVAANCTLGNTTALSATPLNSSDPSAPRPEQAIQYYRASSVVLTLDGYNNTAALSDDPNVPDTPLPSWVDTSFLDCLNQTIGAAVPLIDASSGAVRWNSPSMGMLGLIWIAAFFLAA